MIGVKTARWAVLVLIADNQNTWEYSDNPAVQIYNLERGFFNGSQRMVGKAVRASRLPLAEYTQAANICDEVMSDNTKRYRSNAIAKDGPGANHDANLTPILEAMCGSWVERVDGEFPIAGAPQAIVATITDNDVKKGAPLRMSVKRKRTELINTVAASYISVDDFYETKDAATRIDTGALAEDRETLASAIPYGAVTDPKQVDRLADIAIRGARYQASAEITVHPKFLDMIKEGRWLRWNSAKYGDRTFQVLTRQLGGINTDGARDISIALQQISNGVFDPTAYETNPPNIVVVPRLSILLRYKISMFCRLSLRRTGVESFRAHVFSGIRLMIFQWLASILNIGLPMIPLRSSGSLLPGMLPTSSLLKA